MRNPSVSRPATILMNLLVATKDGTFVSLARWSALLTLRGIVLRFGDPIIGYTFCGSSLRLPLSHTLPLTRRCFSLYSENLGRIAAQLYSKFGAFSVIDIGANVGDTVAVIHKYAPLPILCIEGTPKFGVLLEQNVKATLPASVIEHSFVGIGGEPLTPVVHDGTARLEQTRLAQKKLAQNGAPSGSAIPMKSLDQILEEHPQFKNSRLLKIDTDGMDIAILNSALDWISQQKPVLFFEYDPDLQRAHGAGGLEVLGKLKRIGYHRVLVYDAGGDYMFSTELENTALFSELHEYFSGRNSTKYCDLCVFHQDDEQFAEGVRLSEMNVFRAARKFSPA